MCIALIHGDTLHQTDALYISVINVGINITSIGLNLLLLRAQFIQGYTPPSLPPPSSPFSLSDGQSFSVCPHLISLPFFQFAHPNSFQSMLTIDHRHNNSLRPLRLLFRLPLQINPLSNRRLPPLHLHLRPPRPPLRHRPHRRNVLL